MTNILSGLSCEQLYHMYSKKLQELQGVVDSARDILRNMSDLVSFPFKRIEALVDEYLSALKNMEGLLDLSSVNDVIAALKKMLDCPILADSFGKQIVDILETPGKKIDALKTMVGDLLQGVADKVKASLAPLKKMLETPFSKLNSAFDSMASTYLSPVFNYLKMLQDCLGNMCAAYKAVTSFQPGSIIKPLEKFGVTVEGGSVKFDKDAMKNALAKKVTDMKDTVKKDYDKMQKNLVEKIDGALQQAGDFKDKASKAAKFPSLNETVGA